MNEARFGRTEARYVKGQRILVSCFYLRDINKFCADAIFMVSGDPRSFQALSDSEDRAIAQVMDVVEKYLSERT